MDLTLALDWDYQRQSIQQEAQQEEQQRLQRTDEIDDSDESHDDHDNGDEDDDGDDEWWKAFEPPPELSLDPTKDRPESSTAVSQILRDLLQETVKGAREPEAGAAEKMDDGDGEAADERNSPTAISGAGVLDAAGMTSVKDHDALHTDNTRIVGASFEAASTSGALRIEQRPTRSSTVETKASQRSSRWGFKKGKGAADKGSVAAIVKMPKPVDDVLRKFFPKE